MITVWMSVIRVSVMGMALPPVTNTAIRELRVSVCHYSANQRSALPPATNEKPGLSLITSSTMSCHCITISHPPQPTLLVLCFLSSVHYQQNSGIGSVSSQGQNSMKVYNVLQIYSLLWKNLDWPMTSFQWFLRTVTQLLKKSRFQLKSFIYQRWHFKSFNVITQGGLWDAIHFFVRVYSLDLNSRLDDWCALCLGPDFVMNEIWHFLVLMKAMKCNHNGLKKNGWLILPHLWQLLQMQRYF